MVAGVVAAAAAAAAVSYEMWVFTLLAGYGKACQISFGKWVFIFLVINRINSHFQSLDLPLLTLF